MITRFAVVGCIALVACSRAGDIGDSDLDAMPVAIEEVMRIGSVDDPDYGFTGIGGVDVDRDGRIWVFEATDLQFRVYDSDGHLVQRVGGRGDGPGEFRDTPQFGIVGDTVWAIDIIGRRLTLFHRSGAHISTVPVQAVSVPLHRNVGVILPVGMRADGLFDSDMTLYTGSRDAQLAAGADTVQVPRVLYNAAGVPVDTIGWIPRLPPPPRVNREQVTLGANRYYVPQAPSGQALTVTLADGHAVIDRRAPSSADAAALSITRFDLEGDTVWHRSYSYTPRPYDDAVLDSTAWRSARTPGGGIPIVNGVMMPRPTPSDSMEVFNHLRGAMSFPAFQSPVRFHVLARDGALWLAREEESGRTQRWTIIAPDGSVVANVALRRGQYPLWMDRDSFFAIDRDELDVPWLVRYRMRIE